MEISMMKQKTRRTGMKKRLAAFAFAALAAFGAQAVGTEGDIWSLEVVPNYSKGYEYPNSITPHKVG